MSTVGGGHESGSSTEASAHEKKGDHATQAQLARWRKRFQELTGIEPRDGAAVKAWQAAHGVEPTGIVRKSTVAAAVKAHGGRAAHAGKAHAAHGDAGGAIELLSMEAEHLGREIGDGKINTSVAIESYAALAAKVDVPREIKKEVYDTFLAPAVHAMDDDDGGVGEAQAAAAIERVPAHTERHGEAPGRKTHGKVEPASSNSVTVEYASQRIVLESIAKDLRQLFTDARGTILLALSDFQGAVATMSVEPPRGLVTTIASQVAHEALSDIVDHVIEHVSECLGPVTYVIKGVEIVVDAVEEDDKASEAVAKNAVVERIRALVKRGAEELKTRGAAAVDAMAKEHPMDLLALNGSTLLKKPLIELKETRDQIVVAYQKALRANHLRTLEEQIQNHDHARFDAEFERQAHDPASKDEP